MTISKKWTTIGLVVLLLMAGWMAAAAMSSSRVNQLLQTAAQQGWPDSGIKIRNLHHHAGWFTSAGDMELAFIDKCSTISAQDATWVQVQYNMSHLLLPTSLMQFQWTLQPAGEDKAAFEKLFEGTVALNGSGHMRLDQHFDTDFHLPALSTTSSGTHFQMSPTMGFISFGGKGLVFDLSTEKADLRGRGQAVELNNFSISVDLDDQKHGTGTSAISLGKVSSADLMLEGLKISSKAHQYDGRYSMNLAYSLDKASYQQHQLSELSVAYVMNGLHAESVSKLIALSGASCGFQNMTREEHQQMRGALKTLLTQGFSTGLSTFTAKLQGGKVEGKFMLDLAKSDGELIALTQKLKAEGTLQIDNQVLSTEQRQSILDVGFAQAKQQGLVASLSYDANNLKLNDKPFNSPMFTMMLAELEKKLNDFLNNDRKDPAHAMMEDLLPQLSDADLPSALPPVSTPASDSER